MKESGQKGRVLMGEIHRELERWEKTGHSAI